MFIGDLNLLIKNLNTKTAWLMKLFNTKRLQKFGKLSDVFYRNGIGKKLMAQDS
jgi:hypothetical protein